VGRSATWNAAARGSPPSTPAEITLWPVALPEIAQS